MKNQKLFFTIFTIFVFIIFFITPPYVLGQPYPLWGDLKPGTFAVGFKFVETYDYSRSAKPKVSFEGKHSTGETAWPMHISIWYPAARKNKAPQMRFGEYGNFMVQPESGDKFTEQEIERGLEKLKSNIDLTMRRTRALLFKPSDEHINVVLKKETAVLKDAAPEPGNFPVILFGSSGAAYWNQVICEYLASHGFVVVSSGDPRSAMLRSTAQIVQRETNARDLEFLMKYIHKFPNADKNELGLILWSSNSIGGLIFQMRNMRADAVLSIEGHEAFAGRGQTLHESPYFDPVRMRVPFMRMEIPNQFSGRWTTDHRILNNFQYAERYFLTFHPLEHNDMGSSYAMMLGVVPENKKQGYETVCRYTLKFFDAYLKDNQESLAFIQKTPEKHGFADDFLSGEHKPALLGVPTRSEFLDLVLDQTRIQEAAHIFKEAKKNDPELVLFEEWIFNRLGYDLLKKNRISDAIEIFQLNVSAYPNSINVYDSLGETYAASGNKQLAIEAYKKALTIDPNYENAMKALKKLEEK